MRLSSAEEASFVRNKKATLLAHVALREFPQRWPNFVDECLMLRGISSQGDASFELGLLALAELAEDCADGDYNGRLPAKRRTDVLKALNTTAPAVVGHLFPFAQRSYELKRQAATATAQVGNRRLVAALRCLRHFATWVSWDSEAMQLAAVVDPIEFCSYFAANGDLALDFSNEVSLAALLALKSLASSTHLDLDAALRTARSVPTLCRQLYKKGCADFVNFPTPRWGIVVADLWSALASTVGDIFRELCTRFRSLGTFTESHKSVDEAITALPFAMVDVLEASASRKAAEHLLPAFREAARLAAGGKLGGPNSRATATVRELTPRLFLAYVRVACRCRASDDDAPDTMQKTLEGRTYEREFVDDDEYANHFANIRAGMAQLISALVDLDARAVATTCGEKLTSLLTAATTNDANDVGENDDAGWEIMGYAFVVERVVEESLRLRDEHYTKKTNSPVAEAVLADLDGRSLARVLEWRPPEASYDRAYQRLMLLDALRGVLQRASQERLCGVLRELFGYLAFNAPNTPKRHLFKVRRRAAQTLSHAAEMAPRTLVGQFDKLRDGASNIIRSRLLCDIGSQHLCEALVLASNACEDVGKRRALLEAVVMTPLNDLASTSVRNVLESPHGLLDALGVLRPDSSIVDVQTAVGPAPEDIFCGIAVNTLRRSLGLLLGVARRASVCALANTKVMCAAPVKPTGGLQILAADDASAAVLFRTIGPSITTTRTLHALWAPPVSAALRTDPVGRLALAPTLDEIRCKIDPAASGAGGILPRSRSDSAGYLKKPDPPLGHTAPPRESVAAKWACMLNELRSSIYQIARLWIDSRCAFCNDSSQTTASLFSACGLVQSEDATFLETMEHRHVSSLLKHILEPLVLRCPPSLYPTHLAPVLQRVVMHVEARLALSWDKSNTSETAAFYRSSGLAMVAFDDTSQLLMAEAMRRDLSRQYLEVLQVAFALKGELAAPVSLALKAFDKRHKLRAGDDGENGARIQAAQDRRAAHVGAMRECLLPKGRGTDETIAPLIRTVVRSIRSWADVPTCRCAVKIAETVIQRYYSDMSYWPALALLFEEALGALVSEPPWLANAGCEYDMLSLCRASYVALVLSSSPDRVGGKNFSLPPHHEGPRRTLLSLPGISIAAIQHLEINLRTINAHKDQKNVFHELVVIALNAKEKRSAASPHQCKNEENPTADASALREKVSTISNLPPSL